MFRNGIVRAIVDDIPLIHGDPRIVASERKVRQMLSRIPEQKVSYNDDIMDFRPYNDYYKSTNMVLDFRIVPEEFRNVMKCFALNEIDEGLKISTIKAYMHNSVNIILAAERLCDTDSIFNITAESICKAIVTIYARSLCQQKIATAHILQVLDFFRDEMNIALPIDTVAIERLKIFITDIDSGYGECKHSPIVQDEVLDEFIEGFADVMTDEAAHINDRMTAGILLLNTQLGLRISEIPALETNCLYNYECLDYKTRDYIIYNCIKKARFRQKAVRTKTICTPLAKKTIDYLLKLRKTIPGAEKNRFMFIQQDENGNCTEGVFPVDKFRSCYRKVCLRYLRNIVGKSIPGIRSVKISGESWWIPGIHSFRSTFANKLYLQGFNIDFINCVMSHKPAEADANNNTYIPAIHSGAENKILSEQYEKEFSSIINAE